MEILQGKKRYNMCRHLGGGTYGDVFQAVDMMTMTYVAVKILKLEEVAPEHMVFERATNEMKLREIHILCRLQHPNIINLLDAFMEDHKYHLVFELMHTDLYGIIDHQPNAYSPTAIRSCMRMLLQGLAHLHQNSIIHRDVKPDNLLIGRDGVLKLADFGLSCYYNPNMKFSKSEKVFAREYRAPELLRGVARYGPEVDIWAVACVFAELILGHMLFESEDEFEQHRKIYETFLVPNKLHKLEFEYCSIETLRQLFPRTSDDCLDLLQHMFDDDPKRRITAQQALNHRYFTSSFMPNQAHLLPRNASPTIHFDYHLNVIYKLESELRISTRGFSSGLHQAQYVYEAPPSSNAYQAPPSSNAYQAPPSPYAYQAPPSPYLSQAPPAPYAYQAPPSPNAYQAPPSPYPSQAPPAPYAYQAPPSTYAFQAPPPYVYQAPPTTYIFEAPPTPYAYEAPPSPYLSEAPPTPYANQAPPSPYGYQALPSPYGYQPPPPPYG